MISTIVLRTNFNMGGSTDNQWISITVDEFDAPPVTNNFDISTTSFNDPELLGLYFYNNNGAGPAFSVSAYIRSSSNPSAFVNGPVTNPNFGACLTPLIAGRCYQVNWEIVGIYTGGVWSFSNPLSFFYNFLILADSNPVSGKFLAPPQQLTDDGMTVALPVPCWLQTSLNAVPVTYSSTPCCVAEDVPVRTQRGIVAASEIKPGDWLYTDEGEAVQIRRNVRFNVPSREFVQVGDNVNMLIKGEHPIFEDGEEILAKDSTSAKEVVTVMPKIVHTLITEKRGFVDIAGVQVGTWSQDAFDNFVQHDRLGRFILFTYV